MDRPAVRLGRRGRGQVERDPAGPRRGGDRNRRRADVPGGRVVPRHPQGAPAGPRPRRRRVSFRRVLSVPRRGRRGGPGGGARHHPAGGLREGRGGGRGGRSERPGDGASLPAAGPDLNAMQCTPSLPDRPPQLAAPAGAVVGATAFTVWNQSVANEKVYTVSVLSIALVLWLVVRWGDQPPDSRRDHRLVLIVYLLALTATNHLMGVLVAPAVLAYVLATDPRALVRPRFLLAAALVAAVRTSVDLFMPIRAQVDPYLNQGEPTTWRALKAVLPREQFGKPSALDNPMYPPGADNPRPP